MSLIRFACAFGLFSGAFMVDDRPATLGDVAAAILMGFALLIVCLPKDRK